MKQTSGGICMIFVNTAGQKRFFPNAVHYVFFSSCVASTTRGA